MTERTFTSLSAFAKAFDRDIRARANRLDIAVRKTARQSSSLVAKTVPRAFAELADSVHVVDGLPGNANVVADAPHAAAVENGSRPHTPPLAPLIAWVTLRGMQGLASDGSIKGGRVRGTGSDQASAKRVARSLREGLGSRTAAATWRAHVSSVGSLGQTDADPAVVAIARAIQQHIKKHGTKPTKFMANAVAPTVAFLDTYVNLALPDR